MDFHKNYDVLPSLTCVSIKFLRLPPDCLGLEKYQLTVKKAYVVPSFVFCFLFPVAAGSIGFVMSERRIDVDCNCYDATFFYFYFENHQLQRIA